MSEYEGSTVLITGGAGFIGSWLCEYFLNEGASVVSVDNLSTGSWNNIRHLKCNANFMHITKDVESKDVINDLELMGFDYIFHFASLASPIDFPYFPIKILDCNTIGTRNMLDLARRGDSVFVFASSSEVYGDPEITPVNENYWGNCNPVGVRSCYSNDIEILTYDGWKLFQNLTGKDKILTLTKDRKVEYHFPTDIIKQRYVGDLIGFKNYQCDLLVTPNHKMYVSKRNDEGDKEFSLIPAYEPLNWNRSHMLKVANYEGEDIEWFYFPKDIDRSYSKTPIVERIKMDDWLEFFGYYVTEGCVYIHKRERKINGKNYTCHNYNNLIAQDSEKNKDKYEKIKKCLERLPFNFGFYGHQFYITNKQLANYLKRFGKAKEKCIPRELMNVSKRQLNILFDAMILGDGSKTSPCVGRDGYKRKTRIQFCSTSYQLMSDFQEILLKIGCAGNIALRDRRNKNPIYGIYVIDKTGFETPSYSDRYIEKYDGFVYCVNVPNHVIFVRRNGKALFCGNCYDEGKRTGEAYCKAFQKKYDVDTRICRIFNTYGERMPKDGRVMPTFIDCALKNEPITIFGDGEQTRCFLYVDDLINGIITIASNPRTTGIPINIGATNEITINKLAEKIIEITDSTSEIVYKDLPPDDPRQRKPDVSRIEKLGWQAFVDLETGIRRVIATWKV